MSTVVIAKCISLLHGVSQKEVRQLTCTDRANQIVQQTNLRHICIKGVESTGNQAVAFIHLYAKAGLCEKGVSRQSPDEILTAYRSA